MIKRVVLIAFSVLIIVPAYSDTDNCDVPKYNEACGPVAIDFVCRYYGVSCDIEKIMELSGTDENGTTMKGLKDAIDYLGLYSEGIEVTPSILAKLDGYMLILPIMKKLDHIDHYIVATVKDEDEVYYYNYPEKPDVAFIDELTSCWQGHVLVVSPAPLDDLIKKTTIINKSFGAYEVGFAVIFIFGFVAMFTRRRNG